MSDDPLADPFWQATMAAVFGEGATSTFDRTTALAAAARLDHCVDELAPGVTVQPTADAHTIYVDLMMGLALTAESIRARSRGELVSAYQHQESAYEYFARVRLEEIVLDDDLSLPDEGLGYGP